MWGVWPTLLVPNPKEPHGPCLQLPFAGKKLICKRCVCLDLAA